MDRIYLDHATTTPVAADVIQAMLPFLGERFGNASSLQRRGTGARTAIEESRSAVAALIGAPPEEIVFTASASEANNLAIKGIALAPPESTGHIVATCTEHISVLHPLRTLEKRGWSVTLLPVDRYGRLDPAHMRRALTPQTRLVAVAHASGEIGTCQPLGEICRVSHDQGVPVHCDATLTAGHFPWPGGEHAPDLVTMASHLLYGPQGVAALRVRSGLRIAPLIEGGAQEGGLRAGTEAVPLIVGFGAAARTAASRMDRRRSRQAELAARARLLLTERIDVLIFTGHPIERLPGHLSLCVRGLDAEALLRGLDDEGLEASSGSPCTTEVYKRSHVLEAIGIDPVSARGSLILSFGELSRPDDPERAAGVLPAVIARLRSLSPIRPS
jgi:cysteine desulfurase